MKNETKKTNIQEWVKPDFEEIPLNAEVAAYASADL